MKKRFFSTLVLAIAVVIRMLAADVISSDISVSPKVGDSFTVKRGSNCTITYTITKAVSGQPGDASFTTGEVEITKVGFSNTTVANEYTYFTFPGYMYVYYDSPTISVALERGGYRVTSIGEGCFTTAKKLTQLDLDYDEKDIPTLNIGKYAFLSLTDFYGIYVKNTHNSMTFPAFGTVGEAAFQDTRLSMTVEVYGDVDQGAFQGTRISKFIMHGAHLLGEAALQDCPNLWDITVGGNNIHKNAISGTASEVSVTWTGGSKNPDKKRGLALLCYQKQHCQRILRR